MKKRSELIFIDNINYLNLLDKNFTLDDLSNIYNKNFKNSNTTKISRNKISPLTEKYITDFDYKLQYVLLDYKTPDYSISTLEDEYIKHSIINFLNGNNNKNDIYAEIAYQDSQQPEKYYEIIPLTDVETYHLLIVVKEGFLSNLTKSKDELLKFILDCLSFQYKIEALNEHLCKLYLQIISNDSYFNLIKMRSE